MKPKSIDMFDYLFWGGVIGGIFNLIYVWDRMQAEVAADPAIGGTDLASTIFVASATIGAVIGFGISILMWFFLSVRPSNVVRWIYTVLTVLGVLLAALGFATMPVDELVIGLVVNAMAAASVFFLFRPDANEWFAGGNGRWDTSTFD